MATAGFYGQVLDGDAKNRAHDGWTELQRKVGRSTREAIRIALRDYRPTGLRGIPFLLGMPGEALTTGYWGDVRVPFPAELEWVGVSCEQSGSVAIDILMSADGAAISTGVSIVGGSGCGLTAQSENPNLNLSGWTVQFAGGEHLRFHVTSASITGVVSVNLGLRAK